MNIPEICELLSYYGGFGATYALGFMGKAGTLLMYVSKDFEIIIVFRRETIIHIIGIIFKRRNNYVRLIFRIDIELCHFLFVTGEFPKRYHY